MPINKNEAVACITALSGLGGPGLFTSLKTNGYFLKKHANRMKAQEWARNDAEPKGYFEKIATLHVENIDQYRTLIASKTKEPNWTGNRHPSGKVSSATFRKGSYSYERSIDLTDNDFIALIGSILKDDDPMYCEPRPPAANRFVFIADIPAGFVGRCIAYNNNEFTKTKDMTKAVLVVSAGAQPIPFNLFPCTTAQAEGYTQLV